VVIKEKNNNPFEKRFTIANAIVFMLFLFHLGWLYFHWNGFPFWLPRT